MTTWPQMTFQEVTMPDFIGSINNSLIVHDPERPNDLNRFEAF